MTREEFIYGLKACGFTAKDGQLWYAEDDLIKCFDNLYFKSQDGDLISRKALLEKKWDVPFDGKYIQVVDVGDIENAPPISQPQEGHWIEEDMYDGDVAYRCSECNELFCIIEGTPKDNEYNFCPNCGAKMVESQESEG